MTVTQLRDAPRVNTPDTALPPRPRPTVPAHVIKSDAEAIEIAHGLANEFGKEAAFRDREGILPLAELDQFSQSGLWGINVPKAYGGAEVSYATLANVIKIISAADPSLGQIPQNHLAIVAFVAIDSTEEQKRLFFGDVLRGIRYGNAFSESGSRTVTEFETKVTKSGDFYTCNGRKFYSTGALLAHVVPIVGVDEEGRAQLAFADRNAPGLTIINDWSSFGQRTTASGTVIIENVRVPASHVLAAHRAFDRPTAAGPIAQIIQAAVDTGIAEGAIADTIEFVRSRARPWADSGQNAASEDWFTIAAIGDLEVRLHAAESILEKAGRLIDIALAEPNADTVADAAIATAESKVLSTEAAILATNKLFELGGTRSTLAAYNLDRHWRNARTHTLHDPVRWKYFHIGNYRLNGVKPARHAWL